MVIVLLCIFMIISVILSKTLIYVALIWFSHFSQQQEKHFQLFYTLVYSFAAQCLMRYILYNKVITQSKKTRNT